MINQGNNVPDKKIAIFLDAVNTSFAYDQIDTLISKPSKKRDWFTPHFYRCLPLTIGNQYGHIFKSQFDFYVEWDGGDNKENLIFYFNDSEETLKTKFPRVESHFGSGIFTINYPFNLRTPPGVNLITINPPNTILPNITVMTGVIESDNLRRNFTVNLKMQIPNLRVFIPAGTPLAAVIPVPRNYCDKFELINSEDVFSEEIVTEEIQASVDSSIKRFEIEYKSKNGVGKDYFLGKDVYGNKFPDHQGP
jgi:hypothetical protein